ncbi:hypothetical protein IJG11_00830 [Candidatus Saccharibacteria bacterium]|nr:hypothetical protein [Candidatus Saccharibacteria bacterium]
MDIVTKFATQIPDKVGDKQNSLVNDVTGILNAIIAALGIVCVVVMLVGGVNYMTSSGDASKVEKAKKTILYGLIGLVICVLSFALVNWVIGSVLNPPATNEEETALIIHQTA